LGLKTKAAATEIKDIMAAQPDSGYNGLRISVRTRGCSGNAFHMEYAAEKEKLDEEVIAYDTKVWVDSAALMKVRAVLVEDR
jgi:iron-sulfur cluster assembly protein